MSWPTVALGELTTKIGSGATPRGGSKAYKTEGIPLVRSMNVHDGVFRPDGLAFIDDNQAEALGNVVLSDGDVLLNITGASVARCCRLPATFSGGRVNQHVAIIRPRTASLRSDYLEHLLTSPDTKSKLLGIAGGGATREAITKASIENFKIPLPPLEEQKRIAGILDQADALCRLRRRALDRLNTLGQAIFHEMFGDALEDRQNWPNYKLADLVFDDDRINYGVVQPGDHDADGIPIIRVADLTAPAIDLDDVKRISKDIDANYARSRLKGGEILIGCVGSIGTTMIAPKELKGANIARAVARVAVDPKKCDLEFVAEYLRSDVVQQYFQKEVRLVAQPTLNIKQIRETEIVVPPAELQARFLERLALIKESKDRAAKGFANQKTLFASLQHRAFRGEL